MMLSTSLLLFLTGPLKCLSPAARMPFPCLRGQLGCSLVGRVNSIFLPGLVGRGFSISPSLSLCNTCNKWQLNELVSDLFFLNTELGEAKCMFPLFLFRTRPQSREEPLEIVAGVSLVYHRITECQRLVGTSTAHPAHPREG